MDASHGIGVVTGGLQRVVDVSHPGISTALRFAPFSFYAFEFGRWKAEVDTMVYFSGART